MRKPEGESDGEKVGFDIEGAKSLKNAMNKDTPRLPKLIKETREAVSARYGGHLDSTVGNDLDKGASNAHDELHKLESFLSTWIPELNRGIQVISTAPDATMPFATRERDGIRYGTVRFRYVEDAKKEGKADGEELRDLCDDYPYYSTVGDQYNAKDAYEKLIAKLKDVGDKVNDPYYSAAMLSAMGTKTLLGIIHNAIPNDIGFFEGVPPSLRDGQYAKISGVLKPLADAVAAAEFSGTLPSDILKSLFDKTEPYTLAVFIRQAHFSHNLMKDAAIKIFSSGPGTRTADQPRSLQAAQLEMVRALGNHPKVLQELLVDPQYVENLFSNILASSPEYQKALAAVIDKALDPDVGNPDTIAQLEAGRSRLQAFKNIIKLMGDDKRYWAMLNGPVSRELAKDIGPYLLELAKLVGERSAKLRPGPVPPEWKWTGSLYQEWKDVSNDDLLEFFGALYQDKEAEETVTRHFNGYVSKLDLPEGNPLDEANRAEFVLVIRQWCGLATLLVGGLSRTDLRSEEQAEKAAGLLMKPVGELIGKFPVVDLLLLMTGLEHALEEDLVGLLNQDNSTQASEIASKLANNMMTVIQEDEKLDPVDAEIVEAYLKGMLFDPVLEALKSRGG